MTCFLKLLTIRSQHGSVNQLSVKSHTEENADMDLTHLPNPSGHDEPAVWLKRCGEHEEFI